MHLSLKLEEKVHANSIIGFGLIRIFVSFWLTTYKVKTSCLARMFQSNKKTTYEIDEMQYLIRTFLELN